MFIILMGVLVAGILLGVLIISLSFLAQEGEEDKSGIGVLFPAAADGYYGAPLGIDKVKGLNPGLAICAPLPEESSAQQ